MVQPFTSAQVLSGDTPIYQLSVNQLLAILERKANSKKEIEEKSKEKKYVYGLLGLSQLLDCSRPTAQRIKDSGEIPYAQVGRKLVFDADAVLEALGKTPKNHRHVR